MGVKRFEFVTLDTRELDGLLKSLDVAAHNTANRNALNRTAVQVRDEGKNIIPNEYNIKPKDVKLRITKARAKASQPVAKVGASYRPLNLTKFGATQTTEGVSVQVLRDGAKSILSGVFIARPQGRDWSKYDQREKMTISSPLVFGRKGRWGKGFEKYQDRKYKNYPIRTRTGPSLGAMLKSDATIKRLQELINRELPKNLKEEIISLMAKGTS